MKRIQARLGRDGIVDGAVAVALAGLGLVEVWTISELQGSRPAMSAAALALTLPVAFRRRAPLAVLVCVLGMLVVVEAAWALFDSVIFPIGSLLMVTYAPAAYFGARTARAALGLLVAWLILSLLLEQIPVGDLLYVGMIFGAVLAAGRVARARHERAVALADHAALLERERDERARAAVAEERTRIARELHDVVAHSVSVMVVQAGAERRALGDERASTREVLETIEQTGRSALTEMRRLLGMLRKDDEQLALAPQPSMEHLELLLTQVRDAGMPVELRVEGEATPLPPGVDLSAYRIVQEALTNALKHAGPARALVKVRYGRDDLELEIADDGSGAGNGDGGGHGLIGMRERVTLFGGDLATGRREEGGYSVRARLPL